MSDRGPSSIRASVPRRCGAWVLVHAGTNHGKITAAPVPRTQSYLPISPAGSNLYDPAAIEGESIV